MKPKLTKTALYINLIVSAIVLSGCGVDPSRRHYYMLDVARLAAPAETDNEIVLDVQNFTTDSAFASKKLVYRKTEFEYESDFYDEFVISPAIMLTEKTRNWLSQSGLFARVLDPGSYTKPTHTLRANITALYIDVRDKKSPTAVMQIRFFLIPEQPAENSISLAETYNASVDVEVKTAEAFVQALDRCLEQILTDLEQDLREHIQTQAPDL